MAKVLVVDDDQTVREVVVSYLKAAGHEVVEAADGEAALAAMRATPADLVVLDLMMPGVDGLEVCRRLRANGDDVPVVMLTALGSEQDRVVGLELGADDYVTKPFSPRELVARVRAVLRRRNAAAEGAETLTAGDLVFDVPRMRVEVGGRRVELTTTEFQLLSAMARQPGRVFTRSQLLDAIHGIAFESYERAIDAHVKNIRRKIEPDPRAPRHLLTVYGVGYRLTDG
jgi:DNA-binding response OmpR family regulator